MKTSILSILKSIPFIFNINARYKCKKTKNQYKIIVKKYKKIEQEFQFDELLSKQGFDDKWKIKFKNQKPKIFYLGTDEFQDKSGFLQGLNKFAHVTCFTKDDGSYGQYKRNENPLRCNSKRILNLFEELKFKDKTPDILLMQTWAWRIDVDTLIELKKLYVGLKIINISMDDRHTFYDDGNSSLGVFGLLPALDLALTAAPEVVDWYLKEKVPSLYFPEASSLDFFHPLNLEKKYDVGFVGGKYGVREKIVNAILKEGIKVECYGNGWDNGRLPLDETNKFFNECKIVLGVGTIGYCEDFYALKLRDFDAPLSGSCYITHYNKDLKSLYDDDEIILCKNEMEYVFNIKKFLNDVGLLKEYSQKGFLKAKKSHTYESRIESLFKTLRIDVN